ncbi:MAG: PaaX domain-containing protein, C- domain protein [Actinomycetota bacterium]
MNDIGRSLSTRSVLLSTLLGTDPPRLPVARLVRAGAIFGSSEGAVRTALSRLQASGDVTSDDGWYELSPRLADRRRRQEDSRSLRRRRHDGSWRLLVVRDGRRDRSARDALRGALGRHRLAELREGVWGRPDNLDGPDPVEAREQCDAFRGVRPDDPAALARRLWDVPRWSSTAHDLRAQLVPLHDRLVAGDEDALRPGFELSAAVLRHLLADPALPRDLVDDAGAGESLRSHYDEFDAAFRSVLLDWLRSP